jgi:hypothetical protein
MTYQCRPRLRRLSGDMETMRSGTSERFERASASGFSTVLAKTVSTPPSSTGISTDPVGPLPARYGVTVAEK